MQLRAVDVACGAREADHLALFDMISPIDADALRMRIGRDVTVVVPDQDQIAVAFELVARIGDGSAGGRMNRLAQFRRNIDSVVALAVSDTAEGRNDSSRERPDEMPVAIICRHLLRRDVGLNDWR